VMNVIFEASPLRMIDHKDQCYVLYNGNGYCKTGFGLTILLRT